MSSAVQSGHRDPRVVATRQRVLAAVASLLEREGVVGVTHAAVAREAGVGRATVYRHWPKLDDLLADAIEDRLGVDRLVLTGEPVADLRAMVVAISTGVLADTGSALFTALLSQGNVTPQVSALRAEIMVRRMGAIRGAVARGIAEGVIDPTLDPDDAISYLIGPLVHRRVLLGRPVDEAFIDDLLVRVTTVPGARRDGSS